MKRLMTMVVFVLLLVFADCYLPGNRPASVVNAPASTAHAQAAIAKATVSTVGSPAAAVHTQASATDPVYQAILHALVNVQPSVNIGAYTKDSNRAFTAASQVLEEHPEIFYGHASRFWSDGRLEFAYSYPTSTIHIMSMALQKQTDEIVKAVQLKKTQLEKVLYVHDYIVNNTSYDYQNLVKGSIPAESFTAYGVLVNHVGVCDGYAKAINLILNKAGIESRRITGTADGQNHAWNLVQVDHLYYYMDATWDDPVANDGTSNSLSYTYFLVPARTLAKNHQWNEAGLPAATSTRFAYLTNTEAASFDGTSFYYANPADKNKLYKMNIDGSKPQKLADARTGYIAILGDWVFYSNFDNGGYLYKVQKNGQYRTQLNKTFSTMLYTKNHALFYQLAYTGTWRTIQSG